MALRAVAFDLDGTFYRYSMLLLKSLPLIARHARFFAAFGQVRRAIRALRPIRDIRRLQAEMVAHRLSCPPDRAGELIEQVVYGKLAEALRGIHPLPCLKLCLGRLKEAGLKLAVLSDLPVERKLAFLGLEGFWDAALCSETTQYLKPNPEPFSYLAESLGIPPAEILYVGDRYRYDVIGAWEAGLRSAHFSSKGEPGSLADFTFNSYKVFPALLNALS